MTRDIFDKIWRGVIKPKIDHTISDSFDHLVLVESPAAVYAEYERVRKNIKARMDNENCVLDRHKVAAAMAKAIIVTEPIRIKSFLEDGSEETKLPAITFLANEVTALHTAISIVQSFRSSQRENGQEISRTPLTLPESSHGNEYDMHLCKAMMYSREEGSFDVFFFANILFMIEQYSLLANQNKKMAQSQPE